MRIPVIAVLAVMPIMAACATGNVTWKKGSATATAKAESVETAGKAVRDLLTEVCGEKEADSNSKTSEKGNALGDINESITIIRDLSRRYSVTVERECELRDEYKS